MYVEFYLADLCVGAGPTSIFTARYMIEFTLLPIIHGGIHDEIVNTW